VHANIAHKGHVLDALNPDVDDYQRAERMSLIERKQTLSIVVLHSVRSNFEPTSEPRKLEEKCFTRDRSHI